MMQWESVILPLPIVRELKSAEEAPQGASYMGVTPFPRSPVSATGVGSCALSKEPILKVLTEKFERTNSKLEVQQHRREELTSQ
jgi:hypothetical protein